MAKNEFCRKIGIEHPVWNAGMGGGAAGAELAAAVSNAGGLGVLGLGGLPAEAIRAEIRRARTLTDRPIGVNLILPLLQGGEVEVCAEEGVPVVILFWGDPTPHLGPLHAAGTTVLSQVGSVEEARAVAASGVDAVMAQGVEAGGHVRGTVPLAELLPKVVEAVRPLPVVASGGIATAADVAKVMKLGAQAVSVGTRFLCTHEANLARSYKDRITTSRAEDTVLTKLFDVGWPDAQHRALRNGIYRRWEEAGRPPPGRRPGEGETIGTMPVAGERTEVPRYAIFMPLDGYDGDLEDAVLYCGESCDRIDDVRPAAEIVRELAPR